MNMSERIECDSSAESNMNEVEYDFSKADDDAFDWRLRIITQIEYCGKLLIKHYW